MPKGVLSDHTWPDVCESPGALFAPQMPSNVLAIMMEIRPIFLTTFQLRACKAKASRTVEDHNRRPLWLLSPLRHSDRKPGTRNPSTENLRQVRLRSFSRDSHSVT